VPTFVIEGRWAIPGAQDTDTFVELLERARERLAPLTVGGPATPAADGGAVGQPDETAAAGGQEDGCDDGACAR
jgi:hypothetical protein